MADTRRLIEHVIETNPVIKKGLQWGIVNSRALARYMMDVEGVDSIPDAILGIIRRYHVSDGESADSQHIFRGCELSLRNKIAELKVEYHQETMYQVAEFASNVKSTRGERVKLIVGGGFIKVIADQNGLDGFSKTLRPGAITEYSRDLAEVTIHLPPASHSTKGIVGKVAIEMALNDINLAGIVDCAPDLTLLVVETDAPRALEALQQMLKEKATNPEENPALSGTTLLTSDPFREYEGIHTPGVEVSSSPRDTSTKEAQGNSPTNRHGRP
jgi:hypothetical protein